MKNLLFSENAQNPWIFLRNNIKPIFVDRCFDVHTKEDLIVCEKYIENNNTGDCKID